MTKYWFLLAVAFFDLIVAVVLVGWGYRSPAFLFLLMAALIGGYALFSMPAVKRDARGRLQPTELPYSGIIGTLGAIAILVSAAYVATSSTRSRTVEKPVARSAQAAHRSAYVEPAYQAPRSYSPSVGSAVIYKCVDGKQHTTIQSQPCPVGSVQVWVRDATPEPPLSQARREQQARARRAAQLEAEGSSAAYSGGSYAAPGAGRADPEASPSCRAARAADAAYRRQPLRQVKYDGLRRHAENIRRACR